MQRVSHAFVVGGDNGDQIQLGKHEDELSACAAALEAVVVVAADREIMPHPKKMLRRPTDQQDGGDEVAAE